MKKLILIYTPILFLISTLTDIKAFASEAENLTLNIYSEPTSGTFTNQIKNLAKASRCMSYSWKNRGRAPAGYIKGVALGYARSLCRVKTNPSPLTAILSAADTHNNKKDALSHYASVFSEKTIITSTAGEAPLRALFTLGFGLGMRESSGKYCEGWDTSAGSNRSSSAAEAGLFQASYDSMRASPELSKLYDEYLANNQRCLLDVFKEKAACRAQTILGTGPGADFQAFVKVCPAFATEYAMTLLRILRKHFGPINRLEAEVNSDCHNLLKKVTAVIDSDVVSACHELL